MNLVTIKPLVHAAVLCASLLSGPKVTPPQTAGTVQVAAAIGTESSGGGGNDIIGQFKELVPEALMRLENTPYIRDFPVRELINGIHDIRIELTDKQLYVDGRPVDARNWPLENRIELNVDAWNRLNYYERMRLAFHELIGLRLRGRYDDRDFGHSNMLLKWLKSFDVSIEAAVLQLVSSRYDGPGEPEILHELSRHFRERNGDSCEDHIEVVVGYSDHGGTETLLTYRVSYRPMPGLRTDFYSIRLVKSEGPRPMQ